VSEDLQEVAILGFRALSASPRQGMASWFLLGPLSLSKAGSADVLREVAGKPGYCQSVSAERLPWRLEHTQGQSGGVGIQSSEQGTLKKKATFFPSSCDGEQYPGVTILGCSLKDPSCT